MKQYIVIVNGRKYQFGDKASADSFAAYCNDIYHTTNYYAMRTH
jgi:hypothetical protein